MKFSYFHSMSGLGDSVQPSAKGYSNSNLSMCKCLQTEMKVLHTGCYHRPSQSKDSSLPFTLPHPWQFGIEHSLRLPPIRIPGPKQMKVPFAHRTELFESFLPASLLSNHPPLHLGKRQGRRLSGNSSMMHLCVLLTRGSFPHALDWIVLPPPAQFICWSPNLQTGCIWSKEIIKVEGGHKRRALIQYD